MTIPNSVMYIDRNIFYSCSGLEKIVVESDNSYYDSREDCNAIIETHSNELIAGCKHTQIPNSVTSIGDEAFVGCSGLTEVTIPNSVTSIGIAAFCDCSNLSEMTIPNSVTSIGGSAFSSCSGLTSVTIPNSVTSIGSSAFYLCSSLKSVTIPNSVTSISERTFGYCSGLTEVYIPNSVTSIGSWAFGDCSSLTEVIIPNSVTSIGVEAFSSCSSLTEVTIGNSVKSIGHKAFNDCSGLTTLYSLNITPPAISESFTINHYVTVDVYVPKEALAAYQTANVWKEFRKLQGIEGIVIDENNFPDGNFRNYLFGQSYGMDGVITKEEIRGVTTINVSNQNISNLKGIEYFTALIRLDCHQNHLTSLDVSQNTALKELDCSSNQLTSLDVTNNAALEYLNCRINLLLSLNVSKNTALTELDCSSNQLVSLKVNTALTDLYCSINKLTSLDVSNNMSLKLLECDRNQIRDQFMDALINSLPGNTTNRMYTFRVCCYVNEGNICTKTQATTAKAKGWMPYYYDDKERWREYKGSEDGPTSIALPEIATVNVNSTIQLTPTIEPANATTELTWSSDDETIAKVTSTGKVLGVSEGVAIITVRTSNGFSAECFVIVQDISGIEDVKVSGSGNASIYNLSGQKVTDTMKKGIYIINGKKVVVK